MGKSKLIKDSKLLTPLFKDWGFFSFSYFAVAIENIWGLSVIAGQLTPLQFSEWAVITSLVAVLGAISQWGFKTGYMQWVIDYPSRIKQLSALKSGVIFLALSGFLAGLLASIILYYLSQYGWWLSSEIIWLLPIYLSLSNSQVLLVTDLRIRRRVHWVTAITFIRLPCFILLINFFSSLKYPPLFDVYVSQTIASTIVTILLFLIIRPVQGVIYRPKFLREAISLGGVVMLGLLLKYAADTIISGGVRWGFPELLASGYGRAIKIMEPFNFIYFLGFIMAWSPNVFIFVAQYKIEIVKKLAQLALGLVFLGIPLSYIFTVFFAALMPEINIDAIGSWEKFLVIMRFAAFAALSPVGYGLVMSRQYSITVKAFFYELLATGSLFYICILGEFYYLAMIIAAIIPWVTVIFLWLKSSQYVSRGG